MTHTVDISNPRVEGPKASYAGTTFVGAGGASYAAEGDGSLEIDEQYPEFRNLYIDSRQF